jgi:hypothetical protein
MVMHFHKTDAVLQHSECRDIAHSQNLQPNSAEIFRMSDNCDLLHWQDDSFSDLKLF